MAIDYWQLAREFKQGDPVQKTTPYGLSPYAGRVVAVLRGIGFVDVQWPFGVERVSPESLVKVNPKFMALLPPVLLDQSYPTIETEKAKKASSKFWGRLPPLVATKLAHMWHKGSGEVLAYDTLYRNYENLVEEPVLRAEVEKFYHFAKKSADLLIQVVAHKTQYRPRTAAYWVAQNRTYRATGDEIQAGKPNCPRCNVAMRRATYKMQKGSKVRLFACGKCLYLIDPSSVLSPSGDVHPWF